MELLDCATWREILIRAQEKAFLWLTGSVVGKRKILERL